MEQPSQQPESTELKTAIDRAIERLRGSIADIETVEGKERNRPLIRLVGKNRFQIGKIRYTISSGILDIDWMETNGRHLEKGVGTALIGMSLLKDMTTKRIHAALAQTNIIEFDKAKFAGFSDVAAIKAIPLYTACAKLGFTEIDLENTDIDERSYPDGINFGVELCLMRPD